MTFGLGRGVEYSDMPVIRRIVNEAEAEDYRFSSLVLGIVKSEPFQMRIREGGQADTGAKNEMPGRGEITCTITKNI